MLLDSPLELLTRRGIRALLRTRWRVPPVNQAIMTRALRELDKVLDAALARPEVSSRLELIRELQARTPEAPGPATWILSTGRCGTRALHRFFELSGGVKSYHRGQTLTLSLDERNEMLYRILLGPPDAGYLRDAAIRFIGLNLADMAYCMIKQRQYCVTMHGQTVFAPLAARLFPQCQFLFLRRSPKMVMRSFIEKEQYNRQLAPQYVDPWFLDPRAKHRAHLSNHRSIPAAWPLHRKVLWFIHVTNSLGEAMQEWLGPKRCLTLQSENLFAGDPEAFQRLQERMAISDLTLDQYRDHFSAPINAKNTRRSFSAERWPHLESQIDPLLRRLEEAGHF